MTYTVHPKTRIGHIHLKVSDLDRSVAFYRDVLGFDVTQKGTDMAFLSAGGYHHHIGLNTWHSKGAGRAPSRAPGLFHSAFLYPTRAALGAAVKNVVESGVELHGAADHGVSQAVYFEDPDGNGVELCWDRPEKEWTRHANGDLAISSRRLDLQDLIDAADDLQPA